MSRPKSVAPLPVIGPVDDPQSLYHQMRQYLEWQRVRNYSGRTIENRENNLRLFIAWCDERGMTRPQEITRPILERYQRHLFLYRKPNGEALSGGSQMKLIKQSIADGMMPVISYKVPSVQTMINGGYDSWLATLRSQHTSLDADVTATFWHEPRGDMEPAQFRAASLKFFNIVDAPSIAVGPILNGFLLDRRVSEFASYTDAELLKKWEFVAVDSYQSGEPSAPGTSMPARAIPLLEDWMDSVGHPDKPLGLGEYNGFSASAIAGAGEVILSTPEVWFGLAWNSEGDSYAPLEGDRLTAFQRTKADARALR